MKIIAHNSNSYCSECRGKPLRICDVNNIDLVPRVQRCVQKSITFLNHCFWQEKRHVAKIFVGMNIERISHSIIAVL